MGKHTLILYKWSPNLNSQDESMVQDPICIRLLGMPLAFWVEDIFQDIANAFRELLWCRRN